MNLLWAIVLDNVKNILSQPEIQMLFSENPDVYVKKTSSNSDSAPANYSKAHLFVLGFFQTENLLHSVILVRLMQLTPLEKHVIIQLVVSVLRVKY